MTPLDIKRESIFKKYSKNLKLVLDSQNWKVGRSENEEFIEFDEPVYICPLCHRAFSIELIQQKSDNPLTLEDIPPKSLKGKASILTCKECNNSGGHHLDVQLSRSMYFEPFFKGHLNSKAYGSIRINESRPVKGNLFFDKNKTINFRINSKNNSYAKSQIQSLKENWDGSNINFTVYGPNMKLFDLSKLKVAYLMAFKFFGYAFIFNPGPLFICNQLMTLSNEKIPKNIFIEENLPDESIGINFITSPDHLKSYLIVFEIRANNYNKKIGVVIPGPTKKGLDLFKNFTNVTGKTNFKLKHIPSEDFITTHYLAYLKIWNQFIR